MLCTNKQDYLRELSGELKGYFKKRDVRNIISDYEEFFDAGISEGKSEAEICENFGDIQNLAREIADNQTDVKRGINGIEYMLIFVLAAAVIFLYWLADYKTIRELEIYSIPLLHFLPFSAPVLILLFIKSYKKYEIKLNERILFFIAFIPAIIEFIHIYTISSVIKEIFLTKTAFIFIIAIYIILTLRKEKIEHLNFLAVLYILTGSYQSFNKILYLASNMDSPTVFPYRIADSLNPLYVGLIIAAIIYIYSFWHKYLPKFNIPKVKFDSRQKERDK